MLFSIVSPQFFDGYDKKGWIISVIRDFSLLQAVGIRANFDLIRFNPPDWYVSVLLWGSIVLYLLLRLKYVKVILCIIITCTYSYYFIFQDYSLNDLWEYHYIFFMPLWRALAGMSTGILLGTVIENENIKKYFSKNIQAFNICTLISIAVVCFCIISPNNYDFLCYLCFICIIINLFMPHSLEHYFNRSKYLKSIPDMSFEILLLHKILIPVSVKVASIIGVLDIPILKYIIYACITIIASLIFNKKITPFLQRFAK